MPPPLLPLHGANHRVVQMRLQLTWLLQLAARQLPGVCLSSMACRQLPHWLLTQQSALQRPTRRLAPRQAHFRRLLRQARAQQLPRQHVTVQLPRAGVRGCLLPR